MKILIEVEVDNVFASNDEVVWNIIDAVYHTPDVKSVVRMEFRADKGGGMWHPVEHTRRPSDKDLADFEGVAEPTLTPDDVDVPPIVLLPRKKES